MDFFSVFITVGSPVFERAFRAADQDNDGVLDGKEVASFLRNSSNLPVPILKTVWQLVSKPGASSLDKNEFCLALQFVALALKGLPLTIPVLVEEKFKEIPEFAKSRYEAEFMEADSNHDGKLDATDVKRVLSGIAPVEILRQCWILSNSSDANALTKVEYLICRHLIDMAKMNVPLPAKVPSELIESAKEPSIPPSLGLNSLSGGLNSLSSGFSPSTFPTSMSSFSPMMNAPVKNGFGDGFDDDFSASNQSSVTFSTVPATVKPVSSFGDDFGMIPTPTVPATAKPVSSFGDDFGMIPTPTVPATVKPVSSFGDDFGMIPSNFNINTSIPSPDSQMNAFADDFSTSSSALPSFTPPSSSFEEVYSTFHPIKSKDTSVHSSAPQTDAFGSSMFHTPFQSDPTSQPKPRSRSNSMLSSMSASLQQPVKSTGFDFDMGVSLVSSRAPVESIDPTLSVSLPSHSPRLSVQPPALHDSFGFDAPKASSVSSASVITTAPVATSVPSWSFSKESGSDFENLPMQSMNDMSEAVSQVESHFSSESSSGSREERFGRASERLEILRETQTRLSELVTKLEAQKRELSDKLVEHQLSHSTLSEEVGSLETRADRLREEIVALRIQEVEIKSAYNPLAARKETLDRIISELENRKDSIKGRISEARAAQANQSRFDLVMDEFLSNLNSRIQDLERAEDTVLETWVGVSSDRVPDSRITETLNRIDTARSRVEELRSRVEQNVTDEQRTSDSVRTLESQATRLADEENRLSQTIFSSQSRLQKLLDQERALRANSAKHENLEKAKELLDLITNELHEAAELLDISVDSSISQDGFTPAEVAHENTNAAIGVSSFVPSALPEKETGTMTASSVEISTFDVGDDGWGDELSAPSHVSQDSAPAVVEVTASFGFDDDDGWGAPENANIVEVPSVRDESVSKTAVSVPVDSFVDDAWSDDTSFPVSESKEPTETVLTQDDMLKSTIPSANPSLAVGSSTTDDIPSTIPSAPVVDGFDVEDDGWGSSVDDFSPPLQDSIPSVPAEVPGEAPPNSTVSSLPTSGFESDSGWDDDGFGDTSSSSMPIASVAAKVDVNVLSASNAVVVEEASFDEEGWDADGW